MSKKTFKIILANPTTNKNELLGLREKVYLPFPRKQQEIFTYRRRGPKIVH